MKDTNLNIRINSELLEQAKKQAEIENRTLSNYIITLIKKDLKKEEMEMEIFKSKGYVWIKGVGYKMKERVYDINGVDCVNLKTQPTASGDVKKFYDIKDINKDEDGFYTSPKKAEVHRAKGFERNKFEKEGFSISDDEQEYKGA